MAFLSNRVHGVYHAFMKIVTEGGIRGLWAGWVPNVQRAALVNLGGMNDVQRWKSADSYTKMFYFIFTDLMTYDTVKHFLLRNTSIQDNILCHGLSR